MISINLTEKNKDILVTAKEYVKGDKGDIGPVGPVGPRGPAGVAISDTEPADDVLVWLVPSGDASGYIVSVAQVEEMLKDYALKSDIPEVTDLSNYALKTDIPDVSGFQTAEQVQAAINEALGVIENGTY